MGIPNIWDLTPIGGLIGLAVLIVLLVVFGIFIPRSTHIRELNAAKLRGDEWKETAKQLEKTLALKEEQLSISIRSNKIVEQFLRAAGPSVGDTAQILEVME